MFRASSLYRAGCANTITNRLRRFAWPGVEQLFLGEARDFDVQVDAIQQRAGDALLVLGDGSGGASTRPEEISVLYSFRDRIRCTGKGAHNLNVRPKSSKVLLSVRDE